MSERANGRTSEQANGRTRVFVVRRSQSWRGAAERRAIDWERLRGARLAENDWERLRKTGKDWEARQQDDETARPRDDETARPRDDGTARLRDRETPENTGVLRCSQAFSAVRGSAWRAWQLGVRRVADVFYRKRECRGIVLKRTAHGTLLFGIGRRCATITTSRYLSTKCSSDFIIFRE